MRLLLPNTCSSLLILIGIACLSGITPSGAQTLIDHFEQYDTRQGLPHEYISCLTTDDQGFLWIGTAHGLARYDGHEFKPYELDDTLIRHAQTEVITALLCDDSGLWVGSIGRVLLLNPVTQQWNSWPLPLQADGRPYRVTSIASFDSSLYLGTFNGCLLKLELATGILHTDTINHLPLAYLRATEQGVLISTDGTIYQKEYANNKSLRQLAQSGCFNSHALILRKDNVLQWRNNAKKLLPTHHIEHPRLSSSNLIPLVKGFIGLYEEGLILIDSNGNIANELVWNTTSGNAQPSGINCALRTGDGVLWLGTKTGLIRLVEAHFHFKKHHPQQNFRKLPSSYIRSIYVSRDTVWLGAKQGVIACLPLADTGALAKARSFHIVSSYSDSTSTINTFLRLSDGTLLAGGLEGVFVLRKGKFVPLITVNEYFGNQAPQIWTLAEDGFGRVWIGTLGNGILVYDKESHNIISIKENGTEGLSSNNIWLLFTDSKGGLWAGTQQGLDSICYTNSSMSFTSINEMVLNRPDGQEVWQVAEDDKGNFWIGTTDHGLAYFNRTSRTITNFHKAQGLGNEAIAGLALEPNEQRLWISTMNGLFAFDINKNRFSEWTMEDGLIANEYNFKAIQQTVTGEILLGSKSGLMRFHPDHIQTDTATYPLQITRLRVGNDEVNHRGTLNLPLHQRQFSVAYSLLDYSAPQKHLFRHKLLGVDDNWIYTDYRERLASYNNLAPGAYELLIEASADKEWRTAGSKRLLIKVPARLIEKAWFKAFILLCVLAGMTGIVYYRMTSIRQKARVQVKMAELERRMLTAQMNPHFLFNSMNAIQQFILSKDTKAAQHYLNQFSQLIRKYLEASSKKVISLRDELALLKTYTDLEQARFENRFEVVFEIDGQLDLDETEIPNSLVQPFVENAIIHGLAPLTQQGKLVIRMTRQNAHLIIWVDDNGVGRVQSENDIETTHKSYGMQIVSELAKTYTQLKGFPETEIEVIDKQDEQNKAIGTKVIISVAL